MIESIVRSTRPSRLGSQAWTAGPFAGLLASLLLSGAAVRADQPEMQNALSQLQAAKASLQAASHNKGGHRVKAIRLIDQAIVEVQLGIDAAR